MLKAKLTLTSKIFKREKRDEFSIAVEKSTDVLFKKIIRRIKDSKPTGNIYRIRLASGRIKKHQASAIGQAPAILSRNLIDSIRKVKVKRYTWRIRVDMYYGAILDAEDGLNRPFFQTIVDEHEEEDFKIKENALLILIE